MATRLRRSRRVRASSASRSTSPAPTCANRGLVFACDPLASGRGDRAGARAAAARHAGASPSSPPTSPTSSRSRRPAWTAGADGADHDQHAAGHGHRHRPDATAARRGHRWPVRARRSARSPSGAIWQVRAAMLDGRLPDGADRRRRGSAHRAGRPASSLLAGASAVQVGTATFNDPSAPVRVRDELARVAAGRGFASFDGRRRRRAHPGAGPEPSEGQAIADRSASGCARAMAERRAAVRRHRPARGAARARGGCPTTSPGWRRFAMTCVEALRRARSPRSSRSRRSSSGSARPGSRCSSAPSPGCARPARCRCSTSSAATSARR